MGMDYRPMEIDGGMFGDSAPRRRKRRKRWPAIGFIVAIACSATVAFSFGFGNRDERGVREMASALLHGVTYNNLDQAAAIFLEGEEGAPLMEAELTRVGAAQPALFTGPASLEQARALRRDLLNSMRMELTAEGVNWAQVEPLAFGGALAEVRHPDLLRRPATGVTGNVYFRSQDKYFAIELSAKRCHRNTFVITDIWKWRLIELGPEGVQAHALRKYLAFKEETGLSADDPAEVNQPRFVFVELS